jgi:FAD:protein FMN transferase
MKLYVFDFKSMGCRCSMQIYCKNEDEARSIFALCIGEANRLDKYYSNYSETSFASEINRTAGDRKGIIVDPETAYLLDYAKLCFELSDGLFDMTAGILQKAWNFHHVTPALPAQNFLNKLLKLVGWNKVIWQRPKLILPHKGMLLDFGGIVKEYAADCLATLCYSKGIRHGIIDMSGDMKVIGPHPDGSPWRVQIKSPRQNANEENAPYMTVEIQEGALATSGDYEKCFLLDNKRYCHIINPKTGWPCHGLSSVTVITELCIVAGSLTTAALLKGKNQGISWLKRAEVMFYCFDDDGKLVTE